MKEAFLHKYYSVGKTSVVRRAIGKFSQGPGEIFYEAWERLRDLLKQCPHMVYLNMRLLIFFMIF